MAQFSVDSDAVLTATGAIRNTADRLQSETAAMLGQLTQLQSSWTGSAAIAFQSVVDRWRLTQRDLALAIGTGERFIVELEAGKATAQLGKALAAAKAVGIRLENTAGRR